MKTTLFLLIISLATTKVEAQKNENFLDDSSKTVLEQIVFSDTSSDIFKNIIYAFNEEEYLGMKNRLDFYYIKGSSYESYIKTNLKYIDYLRETTKEFVGMSDSATALIIEAMAQEKGSLIIESLEELLEINGKPQIRWGDTISLNRAAWYEPRKNIIYISYNSFLLSGGIQYVISEISHSKQWLDPKKMNKWSRKRGREIYRTARKMHISFDEAQLYEYENPKTVEYEAHKIIEPLLMRDFYEILWQKLCENP